MHSDPSPKLTRVIAFEFDTNFPIQFAGAPNQLDDSYSAVDIGQRRQQIRLRMQTASWPGMCVKSERLRALVSAHGQDIRREAAVAGCACALHPLLARTQIRGLQVCAHVHRVDGPLDKSRSRKFRGSDGRQCEHAGACGRAELQVERKQNPGAWKERRSESLVRQRARPYTAVNIVECTLEKMNNVETKIKEATHWVDEHHCTDSAQCCGAETSRTSREFRASKRDVEGGWRDGGRGQGWWAQWEIRAQQRGSAPIEVTEHGKILDVMPTQIGMMTSELVLFYASSGSRHMICEQGQLIARLSRYWVGFQSEKAHSARKNLHKA
ncbi:hypothetical protein B0H13DRAFT_1877423 [Mycena leptocephala]|nr:hypothetical protein B0H13DRAFT_1877423 [Mycena leptocephala]